MVRSHVCPSSYMFYLHTILVDSDKYVIWKIPKYVLDVLTIIIIEVILYVKSKSRFHQMYQAFL